MENKAKNGKAGVLFYLIMILLPLLAALICLGIGRYSLTPSETVKVLFSKLTGADVDKTAATVIYNVRLPRILLAAAVGAGLSCAGAAFQGLFSNPLATPDTLGVASGASFGAVLAMLFGGNLVAIQLTALVFGLLSCFVTYSIGKTKGRSNIVMIVLAGIVISAVFEALVSLLKYLADPEDQLPQITYWLMGSMSRATYGNLALGIPFIAIGVLIIFLLRWRLNILSLNEDEAHSLGMNTQLIKCMIGLLKWKSGCSELDGTNISQLRHRELWQKIAYVPQAKGSAFSYSAIDMVTLGRSAHLGTFSQPGKEDRAAAERAMEDMGITYLHDKLCNEMSGGELQMVLIARALTIDPCMLVLDEPESNLDFKNQLIILDTIKRLSEKRGISAIVNTHYPEHALKMSDKALILNRDGTSEYGAAEEVINEENMRRSFSVQVYIDNFEYDGVRHKSVVPLYLV